MRLQALAEVCHAHASVDDGEDEQDDGDDGEAGQWPPHGVIRLAARARLIHADEFEKEIGEASEVEGLMGLRQRANHGEAPRGDRKDLR